MSFASGGSGFDLLTSEVMVFPILPTLYWFNLFDKNILVHLTLHVLAITKFISSYLSPLSSLLNYTHFNQAVFSLTDQLEMFKKYIERIKIKVGDDKTQTILSKSIYVLCTGSDDIANTYFSTPFRRFQYDVPAYTDLMLSSATSFLKVRIQP